MKSYGWVSSGKSVIRKLDLLGRLLYKQTIAEDE